MVQRVVFGVPNAKMAPKLIDLNWREMATLSSLVVLVFWIGFHPNPVLTLMHRSVNSLVERMDQGRPAMTERGETVLNRVSSSRLEAEFVTQRSELR